MPSRISYERPVAARIPTSEGRPRRCAVAPILLSRMVLIEPCVDADDHHRACVHTSLVVDGLGLGVKGFALSRLPVHGHETGESKRLPGRCHGLVPALDVRVRLLPVGTGLLTDDLARRVPRQCRFGETTHSLQLGAPEDNRLGTRALSNCRHSLGLIHGLHRLHTSSPSWLSWPSLPSWPSSPSWLRPLR